MATHQRVTSTDVLKQGQRTRRLRIEPFREQLAALVLGRQRLISQAELITSLNEVADAVSSALGIEEVLECIADRAKRISDADKSVLVLVDDYDGGLDLDTIMVRGRRDQHPQEWWQERLGALADRVFESHEIAVESHPEHGALITASPIRVKDHPIGLICAINVDDRPVSQTQLDYLSILSAFAASAIENSRMAEESRYVLLASERSRIAHEMHDGVVQSLFSVSLGLEVCKVQVRHDPAGVAVRLDELQSNLNIAMTELRRFVYDLRPVKLTELGLKGALEFWIREVTLGSGVKGSLVVEGTGPTLAPAIEACLYRVAKESVSNVMRHAQASRFEVRLDGTDELVRLQIADNGCGFPSTEMIADARSGLGLRGMRERVRREGGALTVESAPGAGTTITAELRPEGL